MVTHGGKEPALLCLFDTPTEATGFGRVSQNLGMRWAPFFKRIDVWGINYHGFPWDGRGFNFHAPPFRLFPACPGNSGGWQSASAMRDFLQLLEQGNYTHVFLMQDTFNLSRGDFPKALKGICDRKGVVSLLYFPVDAPLEPEWTKIIQAVDIPVAYTDYGRQEALRAIGPTLNPGEKFETRIEVMPHGVDQKVYEPLPLRGELRKTTFKGSDEGDFVLLNVNQNQRRKDPVRSLEILRALLDLRLPVRLLMHMNPVADMEHIDLQVAARQLGLKLGKHWTHSANVFTHNRARMSEKGLNQIYNVCDLLLSTTLGEGWGLSTIEALAAGCPAAIPRHTACEEIALTVRRMGQGEKGAGPTVTLLPIERYTVCQTGDNTRLRRRVNVEGAALMLRDLIQGGQVTQGERPLGLNPEVANWLNWDRIASAWLRLMDFYKEPKELKACHGQDANGQPAETARRDGDTLEATPEVAPAPGQTGGGVEVVNRCGIPRRVWHTYKTLDLPADAARCVRTWPDKNHAIIQDIYSDQGVSDFIREHFDERTFRAFKALPAEVGVMKADFWRYAVLYACGGIYADVDCSCLRPVDEWLRHCPPGDCLVVALENDTHWCQWCLAATPKHPVLAKVLDMMVRRIEAGIDVTYEHFVHATTGPGIWSEAVHTALGLQHQDAIKNFNAVKASPGILALNDRAFHGLYVDHHFGSRNFGDGYVRWVDERKAAWEKAQAGKVESAATEAQRHGDAVKG